MLDFDMPSRLDIEVVMCRREREGAVVEFRSCHSTPIWPLFLLFLVRSGGVADSGGFYGSRDISITCLLSGLFTSLHQLVQLHNLLIYSQLAHPPLSKQTIPLILSSLTLSNCSPLQASPSTF
jgi:hypothetical protein